MTDRNDLLLTVQELSSTYEELSLLYRMSEVFSLLSTEDICEKITREASRAIGVKTAVILFIDERRERLYTKSFTGNWSNDREFRRNEGIIWKSIEARKPAAFCRLKETDHGESIPELESLMVCPIVGKVREIGAIVVGDKESDEEFYSNDSKLLMAISAQAGLAIENALLHTELETFMLGAISSLVKALEASSFWTAGHTERVTSYSVSIGQVMGLDKDMIEKLRICALLHDIGKIATPKEILNKQGSLEDEEWLEIKKHPILGAEILAELRQFKEIILSIKYHHEYWNGTGGIHGLKNEEIPLMARILAVADAFDAMTSDRPYRKKMTKQDAVKEMIRCSGTQFDPAVVNAFMHWVTDFNLPHQVSSP